MRELKMEQIEYAVGRLVQLVESREMTQTQLAQRSGVNQSTISKIISHSQDDGCDKYTPSEDILKKLFQTLGLKLTDILNESDHLPDEILGYLATPLTDLSRGADTALRQVVEKIRFAAANTQFEPPHFEIYWPGDHTHPRQHAEIPANQVYVTDRSRAATYDFIVLFCGAPSYGVGQENEIATQSGVPAIRLIPERGLSRMMIGSFICAIDIQYSGTLDTGIAFNPEDLQTALKKIKTLYFRRRAMDRGLNMDSFGARLKRLIDDRCGGDYIQFSSDLGISLTYLHNLMREPFSVSNPSARLLGRLAVRLGERIAYLLGESEENDPIWIESNTSWRQWINNTTGIDARDALELRDQWRHTYRAALRNQDSAASFRSSVKPMRDIDWDKLYQKRVKRHGGSNAAQSTFI